MPVLGDSVYTYEEYRHNLSYNEIKKHLRLKNKTAISTGHTTDSDKTCGVFSCKNDYIEPKGYIEGRAAVFCN